MPQPTQTSKPSTLTYDSQNIEFAIFNFINLITNDQINSDYCKIITKLLMIKLNLYQWEE